MVFDYIFYCLTMNTLRYSHCSNRCWVPVLCVSFSRLANALSNKVSVVVVWTSKIRERRNKYLIHRGPRFWLNPPSFLTVHAWALHQTPSRSCSRRVAFFCTARARDTKVSYSLLAGYPSSSSCSEFFFCCALY